MRHPISTLALATSLCASALVPASSQAAVRDCNFYADYPNVKITSARNMSCGTAVKVMAAYRGSIQDTFKAPQGFACRKVRGKTPFSGEWRCTKGAQAFRFYFVD